MWYQRVTVTYLAALKTHGACASLIVPPISLQFRCCALSAPPWLQSSRLLRGTTGIGTAHVAPAEGSPAEGAQLPRHSRAETPRRRRDGPGEVPQIGHVEAAVEAQRQAECRELDSTFTLNILCKLVKSLSCFLDFSL